MQGTALPATPEPAPLAAEGVPDRFHFRKQPYRLDRLYGFLCDALRYDTAPHLCGEDKEDGTADCVSVSAHGLLYVLACLCRTAGRIDPQTDMRLTLDREKEDGCLSLSVAGRAGDTLLRDAPLLFTAQKVGHSGHFRFEARPDREGALFRFRIRRYAADTFTLYETPKREETAWLKAALAQTDDGHTDIPITQDQAIPDEACRSVVPAKTGV